MKHNFHIFFAICAVVFFISKNECVKAENSLKKEFWISYTNDICLPIQKNEEKP